MLDENQGYVVRRVGESFSLSRDVSLGGYLGADGILIRVENTRSARDMRDVFRATGGKAAREEEWILPEGAMLRLNRVAVEPMDMGGQARPVTVYYMEEIAE